MCGRYSFTTSKEKLIKQFGNIEVGENLRLNFNVAPTQRSYVITDAEPHRLNYYIWGLLPYWSRDDKITGRLINARMEGIESKPSFRVPLRRRRCWVLADSFYEWRREGSEKIPYRIHAPDEGILVMAGIWDQWKRDGKEIHSYSIITCPPNREMAQLHNRMPVILTQPEQREAWLAENELDDILPILHTPPDGCLTYYRVSQEVNSVANNGPELHQAVADNIQFDL